LDRGREIAITNVGWEKKGGKIFSREKDKEFARWEDERLRVADSERGSQHLTQTLEERKS